MGKLLDSMKNFLISWLVSFVGATIFKYFILQYQVLAGMFGIKNLSRDISYRKELVTRTVPVNNSLRAPPVVADGNEIGPCFHLFDTSFMLCHVFWFSAFFTPSIFSSTLHRLLFSLKRIIIPKSLFFSTPPAKPNLAHCRSLLYCRCRACVRG